MLGKFIDVAIHYGNTFFKGGHKTCQLTFRQRK